MRRILIALLDVVVWIACLATTAAGVFAGGKYYPQTYRQAADFDWGLGIAGGLAGLIVATLIFGIVAVLIQIEENTRRNSDVFTALVRRAEARLSERAQSG
jgi:uncharacterized membrane protein